jgi:hypothetical protein
MILVPSSRPLYAAVDPVDCRRSFDMRIAIAREQLGLDALRSAVVLFFNKDHTRGKLLFRDGSGVVILCKRLDRAHFHIPSVVRAGDRSVRIEARELGVLLAGIERR